MLGFLSLAGKEERESGYACERSQGRAEGSLRMMILDDERA
jgi:hypothetical protein